MKWNLTRERTRNVKIFNQGLFFALSRMLMDRILTFLRRCPSTQDQSKWLDESKFNLVRAFLRQSRHQIALNWVVAVAAAHIVAHIYRNCIDRISIRWYRCGSNLHNLGARSRGQLAIITVLPPSTASTFCTASAAREQKSLPGIGLVGEQRRVHGNFTYKSRWLCAK
jgi:hypothetical protein